MKNNIIKICVTLGDPAGIGPEVALKAANEFRAYGCSLLLLGRIDIVKTYYPGLLNNYIIIDPDDAKSVSFSGNSKYFLDFRQDMPLPVPGKGNVLTGAESRSYIDKAVELWTRGFVDAIVTGPVSKSYIEKSGIKFTGHTEYIAGLIGQEKPYMLMYSDEYRVLLVTTHIPVSAILDYVNADNIYNTIKTGHIFLRSINSRNNKIAIAGLDPHCGDDGAIGDFDKKITAAAVSRAKKEEIDIEGPFSADTLFTPEKWKSYGLAIAHYHDQGLIPFKVLAFESGVNVTLGLSIVRTSPDHGTAFDIAGKNKADHRSMLNAIALACRLSAGQ